MAVTLASKAEFKANAKTVILTNPADKASSMTVPNFLADVARKARHMQEMAQAITKIDVELDDVGNTTD